MATPPKMPAASGALEAVRGQREIQTETEQHAAPGKESPARTTAQTTPRKQPRNPLPTRHKRKMRIGSDPDPRAPFMAPGCHSSDKSLEYWMTKGGIHAFTKTLALNVVPRGICVNIVAPSPVWTPLNDADQLAEDIKKSGQSSGMGRPAYPVELSPAYVFLAAPSCSSDITGITVPAMGGTNL